MYVARGYKVQPTFVVYVVYMHMEHVVMLLSTTAKDVLFSLKLLMFHSFITGLRVICHLLENVKSVISAVVQT